MAVECRCSRFGTQDRSQHERGVCPAYEPKTMNESIKQTLEAIGNLPKGEALLLPGRGTDVIRLTTDDLRQLKEYVERAVREREKEIVDGFDGAVGGYGHNPEAYVRAARSYIEKLRGGGHGQ